MICIIEHSEESDSWIATVNDAEIADECPHVAFLWAALQIMDDSDSDDS